jgi:squalene-associated FAD-dependent desaturase
MSVPHVVVVGGGLAGLAAAVACAEAGASLTLLEARPRLGGATWSSERAGLHVDNGQHVFLRCFERYRSFLRRIGVEDRVELQPRLAVPVCAPGGEIAWLRRHALPSPAHLAPSLLRYRFLSRSARWRAARTARRLSALAPGDPALDARRFGDWLREQGESEDALELFWDLLVRPTLNLPAADASLALAAMVFRTGLLSQPAAGDIGWSRVPLSRLHAEPACAWLEARGARVCLRSPVSDVLAGPRPAVRVRGERIEADAVLVCTPHAQAAEILPASAGVDAGALRALGSSPIVNLHVVYDRRVLDLPFAAAVKSPLQFVFDRSRSAGLEAGQYLAVSLSAADAWVGRSREQLRRVFLPALAAMFPAARGARVLRFFATCERAATFHQRPGTARLRPGARTRAPGIYLAGAWTGTGWPATMEGAVRSGEAAAHAALADAGLRPGTAAAA